MYKVLLILILSFGAHARTKKLVIYEQMIVRMGLFKMTFQCDQKQMCKTLTYNKTVLIGEKNLTLNTYFGIKKNFFSNFLKIEKKKKGYDPEKCEEENKMMSIKIIKNYKEQFVENCYDKEDYYAEEFRDSFSMVYKRIPARKGYTNTI